MRYFPPIEIPLLVVTFGIAGSSAQAYVGPPASEEQGASEGSDAASELETAVALYEEGKFEEAARAFRKAFAIEPSPRYLYAWAQAERESGNCSAAVDLYQQFIEQGASEGGVAAAEENISRCEAQLQQEASRRAREEEEEEERRRALEAASQKQNRPWYLDPLGGSLVGVGMGGLVAGGVLLGLAGAEAGSSQETVQDFRDSLERERNLWIAGAVVAGVGGVLVAGGVVRWFVVKNGQGREQARLRLAPTLPAGGNLEVRF